METPISLLRIITPKSDSHKEMCITLLQVRGKDYKS